MPELEVLPGGDDGAAPSWMASTFVPSVPITDHAGTRSPITVLPFSTAAMLFSSTLPAHIGDVEPNALTEATATAATAARLPGVVATRRPRR